LPVEDEDGLSNAWLDERACDLLLQLVPAFGNWRLKSPIGRLLRYRPGRITSVLEADKGRACQCSREEMLPALRVDVNKQREAILALKRGGNMGLRALD